MKLTDYSHNLLMATFAKWDVPKDFADSMYNYLVHGFNPGGFFTSVLANDFHSAIARSHPVNTVNSLKSLGGWILDCVPREAHGSYDAVSNWCSLPPEARRQILEESRLIYTEAREVWMTLEGRHTTEPVLY